MEKFIKISRGDMGFYIQPLNDWKNAFEGEVLSGDIEEPVTFELVEMTEEEYEKLPEFLGW